MKSWTVLSDSTKGIERNVNKDRVWTQENQSFILAVLFDGISSAEDANKGIDLAVKVLNEYSLEDLKEVFSLKPLIKKLNEAILGSAFSSPYTTCSLAVVDKRTSDVVSANVGDSRVYEISPQYKKQLSKDDNLLHNKNVVTRYLGMVDLDVEQILESHFNIQQSRILLCSDGFYSLFEENLSRFYEILNFSRAGNIRKALKAEINGHNSDDASYGLIFSKNVSNRK